MQKDCPNCGGLASFFDDNNSSSLKFEGGTQHCALCGYSVKTIVARDADGNKIIPAKCFFKATGGYGMYALYDEGQKQIMEIPFAVKLDKFFPEFVRMKYDDNVKFLSVMTDDGLEILKNDDYYLNPRFKKDDDEKYNIQ